MLLAPRVGTDMVVHFEDAAEVAAARKPALLGDGIELEVGERQQPHGPFQAHPRERGLRAFVPRLPEEAAWGPIVERALADPRYGYLAEPSERSPSYQLLQGGSRRC